MKDGDLYKFKQEGFRMTGYDYDKKIDQLHSELAELKAQNENLSVRNDMWRKKYEILLKAYCETDVQTDTEECDCTDNCPCKEE
jgi:hypothetical protein